MPDKSLDKARPATEVQCRTDALSKHDKGWGKHAVERIVRHDGDGKHFKYLKEWLATAFSTTFENPPNTYNDVLCVAIRNVNSVKSDKALEWIQ